jgi:oxygen-dependent protoporphyrinogen oxidase
MSVWDRVVIGAGIAGLLAAQRALQRGEKVLVLEGAARVGGALAPLSIGGVTVDAGAESLSTATNSCTRLIDDLGMSNLLVSPQRADARIVVSPDFSYPIPHGVLGIPSSLNDPELVGIISASGLEQAARRDSAPLGDLTQLSVADVVERRLGLEFLEKLVDPVVTGVHGSSARSLNAQTILPEVMIALERTGSLCSAVSEVRSSQSRPGAAVAGIDGGLFQIAQRLADELTGAGVTFRYDTRVDSCEDSDSGWTCHTDAGQFTSQHVRTGFYAPLLSRLMDDSAHALSTRSVDVALVFVVVDAAELNSFPLGSGALITPFAGVTAKATTHVNAKWSWVHNRLRQDRHIIRLSYGRDGHVPPGDLTELARQDVHSLYGISAEHISHTRVVRWDQSLSQVASSSATNRETFLARAEQSGLELCGSFVTGNGLSRIIDDHYRRTA